MNRCVFIIPYFGKFNNYFHIFLKSCAYNADFDWLIFTDDMDDYDYPANVKIIYTNFANVQEMIKGLPINAELDHAYKLCDYKPAYGYIFADYIKNYEWWGYCDTDMIWGRINRWLTPKVLDSYDKIGVQGHCTLIRNKIDFNVSFLESINGVNIAEKVFSSQDSFHFDEEDKNSINTIFKIKKYRLKEELKIADIYTKSSDFLLTKYMGYNKYSVEKRNNGVFVWDDGKLVRYTKDKQSLHCDEYMYIHLQKRRMDIHIDENDKCFKIIPNSFDKLEEKTITVENFNKIEKKHFNVHYFRVRYKFLKEKIKKKHKYMVDIWKR